MGDSLSDYLTFAMEAVWQAGRLTLGYFQAGIRPEFKADNTPVTIADKKAEETIRGMIGARYPGHAIIGEEFGPADSSGASHRWYIDPIDGTRAFVRGVPLYAVLIGLEIDAQPRVGAAYFPALNEMLAAASGRGCWWNGRRASVSDTKSLAEGLLVHADAASFARHGRARAWERLQSAAGFRAGWSDAYGYLLVATGRAELMLDPIMNVWDCAPFPVILEEAGGYFGDWQGKVTSHAGQALATTKTLLPEVLALINDR